MLESTIRDAMEKSFCCCLREVKDEENLRDDGKFHYFKRYKHSILLYGKLRSHFPYHCLVGNDWPLVVVVYFLILLANGVVLGIIGTVAYPVVIIGIVMTVFLLISYSATVCTDPGIIFERDFIKPDIEIGNVINSEHSNGSDTNENSSLQITSKIVGMPHIPNSVECGICKINRPYSARHCNYCNICVDELVSHSIHFKRNYHMIFVIFYRIIIVHGQGNVSEEIIC